MLRRTAALIAALGLSGSCSLPALDAQDYRATAAATVEDVISGASSAILVTRLEASDRVPATTVVVLLEDVERASADAIEAFESVLPPDARSDLVRARLLPTLNEIGDLLHKIRFAARRGDAPAIADLRSTLTSRITILERWLEQT